MEVLSGLGHTAGGEIAADERKLERSFQTSELVRMRVAGLKVGASGAFENAFEVSQHQKQRAVAGPRICFRICVAFRTVNTKSE